MLQALELEKLDVSGDGDGGGCDGGDGGGPCCGLAVAQATYKNIHRQRLLTLFPNISLWLINASEEIRIQRVQRRRRRSDDDDEDDDGLVTTTGPTIAAATMAATMTVCKESRGVQAVDVEWVLRHSSGFEEPTHECIVLQNNDDMNPLTLLQSIDDILSKT